MKDLSTAVPFLFVLAASVAGKTTQSSQGCGKPLPELVGPGVSKNLSIDSASGASPRQYRIHVPKTYDPNVPYPVILSFHGRTRDMLYQEQLTQLSEPSANFDGIVVYPNGVPSAKGTRQWQSDPDAPHDINDVTFTLELLDHLQARYCVDPARLYASGQSNGGGFTGMLACDATASARIAAFAPVSGAFYLVRGTNHLPPCSPARPVIPILELHGAIDQTILYDGGSNKRGDANTTSIPAWVDDWAQRDGFSVDDKVVGSLCSGEKTVATENWKDTVVHYKYANIGHDWMSADGHGGKTNATCAAADATRVVVDFFKKWSLEGTVVVGGGQ